MNSYCVRCKRETPMQNPTVTKAKNGRTMLKGKCGNCGMIKTKFVSADQVKKLQQGGFLPAILAGLAGSLLFK